MQVKALLAQKGTAIHRIGPDETVLTASRLLATHHIGALIVTTDDGALAGILSERDIVRGLGLGSEEAGFGLLKVRDLMTSRLVTCGPDDTIDHLMDLMTNNRIRHLPVLDGKGPEGGRLLGIITIGDVVKVKLEEANHMVTSMRDYISAAG
jgi:CBS domain-containing protein